MTDPKPPLWADTLLCVWVGVVAVAYFGGLFVPAIAALTNSFAAVYAAMVLVSALMLARRLLRPQSAKEAPIKKAPVARPRKSVRK